MTKGTATMRQSSSGVTNDTTTTTASSDTSCRDSSEEELEEKVDNTHAKSSKNDKVEEDRLLLKYFPRRKNNNSNPGFIPPTYLTDPKIHSTIVPPPVVSTWKERYEALTDHEKETFVQFRTMVQEKGWYHHHPDPQVDASQNKSHPTNETTKGTSTNKSATTNSSSLVIDDRCLLRYLIARNYKIPKAMEMLQSSMKWRKEVFPFHKHCLICDKDPTNHCLHFVGWDLQHRPIIYMSYKWAQNNHDAVSAAQHIVESFEHCLSIMSDGVEKCVFCVDFTSYSHWRCGRYPEVSKSVLEVLQDHYPERLGSAYFINPPTSFWILWKLVSVFLHTTTKQKIQFVYTTKEQTNKKKNNDNNMEAETTNTATTTTSLSKILQENFPTHVAQYLDHTFHENMRLHSEGKNKHDT